MNKKKDSEVNDNIKINHEEDSDQEYYSDEILS